MNSSRAATIALLLMLLLTRVAEAQEHDLAVRYTSARAEIARASQSIESSPSVSRLALLNAAGELEAIAASPISIADRAAVLRDLADASQLASDLPRSILAYRRSLLLIPTSEVSRHNLARARDRVYGTLKSTATPTVTPAHAQNESAPDPSSESAFHVSALPGYLTTAANQLPPALWLIAATAGFFTCLVVLSVRFLHSDPPRLSRFLVTGLMFFSIGAFGFAAGAWPTWACRDVVVVASGARLTVSPEEGGQSDAAIAPGVELTVLDSRTVNARLWLKVRQPSAGPDSPATWIPAETVEAIARK